MYYHDKKLQFPVRVEKPDPIFAKMLQQALGGYEGELRVVFQYYFQAWNSRGASKYRDLLIETATEDLGHAEMYATAIALNLEGAGAETQEEAARANPLVAAVMGGMSPRSFLSGGMGALATDSEGNPFDGSWVTANGNLAANMYANVEGEALNSNVASRLYAMTDDAGMKEVLQFFIARDNMHMQQWLAVIEEMGGYEGTLPIPNSFPHEQDLDEFKYTFLSTAVDGIEPPQGRWTSGRSLDGKGEFKVMKLTPRGEEPRLAPPIPQAFAQKEERLQGQERVTRTGTTNPNAGTGDGLAADMVSASSDDKSLIGKIVDAVTGG